MEMVDVRRSGDALRSELAPDANRIHVAPEAGSLKEPDTNHDDNEDIENGLNAGGHWNVAIDHVQTNPYDDEH
jgi:hypothetical protein